MRVCEHWSLFARQVYATFDWRSATPRYYFILGRTDDVINICGPSAGEREEIEESISSYPNVAEVAVVGIKDALKGRLRWRLSFPKQAIRCGGSRGGARQGKRLWRWWTTRSGVRTVVRRMSGLSRSSQKRVPERCFAARSGRSARPRSGRLMTTMTILRRCSKFARRSRNSRKPDKPRPATG